MDTEHEIRLPEQSAAMVLVLVELLAAKTILSRCGVIGSVALDIGPPDGSKPREVLKRPDWLREVENQVR